MDRLENINTDTLKACEPCVAASDVRPVPVADKYRQLRDDNFKFSISSDLSANSLETAKKV